MRLAGHDVATVSGQGLNSTPDIEVIDVCRQEKRGLVTADRGFSNRLRYNPAYYAEIVDSEPKPDITSQDFLNLDTMSIMLTQKISIGLLKLLILA